MSILIKSLFPNAGKKFTIASDLRFLSVIDRIIANLVTERVLSDDILYQLRLLLSEIISNAIIHGNKQDLDKKVIITYQWKDNEVLFRVYDQGNGFDLHNVPDPTCAEKIALAGGRGVFLTKMIANTFSYCNNSKSFSFSLTVCND